MLPENFVEKLNPTCYILPPSSIYIKCTHYNKYTDKVREPMLEVIIEDLCIDLKINKSQLCQLILMLNVFLAIDNHYLVGLYRPEKSPLKDPRAWWYYAYLIVSGKSIGNKDTIETKMNEMTMCLRYRERYIALVKQRHSSTPLNKQQEELFAELEDKLPLCALIVFRQDAMKAFLQEKMGKREKKRLFKLPSWLKTDKKNAVDEDVPIESLLEEEKDEDMSISSISGLDHLYVRAVMKNTKVAFSIGEKDAQTDVLIYEILLSEICFSLRRLGVSLNTTLTQLDVYDKVLMRWTRRSMP